MSCENFHSSSNHFIEILSGVLSVVSENTTVPCNTLICHSSEELHDTHKSEKIAAYILTENIQVSDDPAKGICSVMINQSLLCDVFKKFILVFLIILYHMRRECVHVFWVQLY
jgi:hypothetical protein